MRLLAIDPGNQESGWCLVDTDKYKPLQFGKDRNEEVLDLIAGWKGFTSDGMQVRANSWDRMAIEMVASYGMPVGASVFETCVWIGRFYQQAEMTRAEVSPRTISLIKRTEVKNAICHTSKANDATIRHALADRFAPGAKNYGKGTKASPGWFYGFRADVWQAYALAVTYIDTQRREINA